MSMAPVFIRSLTLVRRFVAVFGTDLTPLESFLFTNRNRAESTTRLKSGESMSKKRPAVKQKGSAQGKVDWKALDIVHPDAAGIDVGGGEQLGGDQPGPRPGTGAALRMLYRRSTR